jgi:putative membrane-bound dehydrogenase-like protein
MSRLLIGLCLLSSVGTTIAAPPRVLDDRLQLELFAEQPQIVTPTGIDVDHLGRVWAIESNTHFPPEGYAGHPTDRVLILEDTDNDGRADRVTTFADGLTHAMSVVVKPVWLEESREPRAKSREPDKDKKESPSSTGSGLSTLGSRPSVFLATRKEILLLRDTDGDLQADERTTLVRLDTPGNYPHNGLAGIAFDALGWMFFGFGENLGADYKLIGSDGVTLSGGGEGGNMYRCRPDGTKLERWATGFWNPHASCFDPFGRLFTVDNDPDSRPPCRLLHIIPGGDYGYRFRNGRKGTHPFTSWNGELPGTLPMVSGTGEAPSGIICYESDGFPDDYLGTLLVGSWGDHRIDQFVLEPKGASFTSRPKPIVQGDDTFRPVGLALAPDGSVYFTDWVLRDYKLHGKGRVWRLSGVNHAPAKPVDYSALRTTDDLHFVYQHLQSKELKLRRTSALRLMELTDDPVKEARSHGFDPDRTPKAALDRITFEVGTAEFRRGLVPYWFDDPNKRDFFGVELDDEEWRGPHRDTVALRTLIDDVRRTRRGDRDTGHTEDGLIVRAKWHFATFYESTRRPGAPWDVEQVKTLLAWRELSPQDERWPRMAVESGDALLQRLAVQWIGEEKLINLRPLIEDLLREKVLGTDSLMACLASLSLLDGVPAAEFEKTPPTKYLLPLIADASKPAALRATALRLLPAGTPELSAARLVEFLTSDDAALQLEAIRTLAQSPRAEAVAALVEIAANPQATVEMRCEAILALSAVGKDHPESAQIDSLLLDGIERRLRFRDPNDGEILQLESIRAARPRAGEDQFRGALEKARETASENRNLREAIEIALAGKSESGSQPSALDPQPSAGRRVFFSPHGPQCAKCHTVHGRGGQVGPDLSVIARTMDRQKLYESIVEPSKEVSPQYLTWVISTTGGQTHTGIVVTESGGGDLELGDPQGNVVKIPRKDIEERTPSPVSVMPQGLHQRMTPHEFADLLGYLETLK